MIFVLVGMQFHAIASSLVGYSPVTLIGYGLAISATVIVLRIAWVFAQALLPVTNEPEHVEGKADWSHVSLLAWSGMRGGVTIAAALAIPFTAAAGPFPGRNLIIFLTFCVLLATLVGQGGTIPWLIQWLHIKEDDVDEREERLAFGAMARAALERLDELEKKGEVPQSVIDLLRRRFQVREVEFADEMGTKGRRVARLSELYRKAVTAATDAQRQALIELRDEGKIDNTVLRRLQRLLDLESEEIQLLGSTAGHSDIESPEDHGT